MAIKRIEGTVPDDFSDRIKRLRADLGFTQVGLADRLGISFATVNRWEKGKARPSQLYWNQIVRLAKKGASADDANRPVRTAGRGAEEPGAGLLDFTS